MTTDRSYIGKYIKGHLITECLAFNEAMTEALYKSDCDVCGEGPQIWIELETGCWRFHKKCKPIPGGHVNAFEQRRAVLLCAAA